MSPKQALRLDRSNFHALLADRSVAGAVWNLPRFLTYFANLKSRL
jgi:hypothetical protein